ncbi:transketolase family protein [Lactiplantibacillus plajomi]|uniref:Transketolase family protein n=1 Tax=Lactiplantibacillus plajomi TaxID=1457217 RepID=A0ABV6K2K8_9LACO|nr:transketolase C-terminal domain-containing protein [Lactiplantibacillus plajomi]
MFKLDERRENGKELRNVVVDSLMDLMNKNDKVIALDADLAGASNFNRIKSAHGKSFIDVGISEANMIGVSAGLSLTGYTPYVHTFAPFVARRALDQVYMSGAYSKNTINIYGSDPGFNAGFNGGTHTSYEDVAIMRSIPETIVCDPADAVQMEWIIKEFSNLGQGIHYVRGNRKSVRNVYAENSSFEIGKGNLLYEGSDLLIIATGQLVSEAIDVHDELSKIGISSDVVDMFTIKPLDTDLLLERAKNKRGIVTIENHNIIGGLGSAVSEVMAEKMVGVPLLRVGNEDYFGQVGTPDYLQQAYGLTSKQILSKVKKHFSF